MSLKAIQEKRSNGLGNARTGGYGYHDFGTAPL
jgi:hypothetical protein